jgi:hypothetical protein
VDYHTALSGLFFTFPAPDIEADNQTRYSLATSSKGPLDNEGAMATLEFAEFYRTVSS